MKHTKGEWKVLSDAVGRTSYKTNCEVVAQSAKDKSFIKIVDTRATSYVGMSGEEQQANARLIAAAPEMLERLCEVYDEGLDDRILMENIDKTLKKAKGE